MVKKIKYFENSDITKSYYNSILLIGNFDGLHLGHRKIHLPNKTFTAFLLNEIFVLCLKKQ